MPEGVLTLEAAVDSLDIACAFKRRFAGVDSYMLQTEVSGGKQGALTAEFLIFYCFHIS